jgi:hypothetical protein
MRDIIQRVASASAVVLLTLVPGVEAGVITTASSVQLPGGVSTGTIGPLNSTPAPNNDEVPGANPNAIAYNLFINAPGPMDVEFVVGESGGITEYRFAQGFLNNSRGTWTGWRFELGFGTGSEFVRSQVGDGLDFDAPSSTLPSSPQFGLSRLEADVLEWTGQVPWLGRGDFAFAIDVPDGLAGVNPSGLGRFTLRQIQNPAPDDSVPEPSMVVLSLCGLGWAGRRLRSRF